jgi:type 1 glutamine amidotransferase
MSAYNIKKYLIILFLFLSALFIPAEPMYGAIENSVSASDASRKPRIVFLITEDPLNYEAHNTIPIYAERIRKKFGYEVTVLLGSGPHGAYRFTEIEKIKAADLLVVFSRRIALPHDQMNVIKEYLANGKPLIGIRTANHAFTARTTIEPGFEDWPGFVAEMLGCENRGYGPEQPGTEVTVNEDAIHHPILKGVESAQWHSDGNIYKVAPLLDSQAKVLLTGKVGDLTEPIAWIRKAGKSKVFYTSLGYPTDFKSTSFLTLLDNAIQWSLNKKAVF